MNISSFVKFSKMIPPHIAILMRASTGVGKSALVAQYASEVNKTLIDVRGSLMSEGDVGGYPDVESMKTNGVMTFCMPSWFVRACNEPVVLFLDELNRSLPTVQQSFFQLVLDRQLGNDKSGMPYTLHPETQIFAAINHGSEYDVNDMDPALLRRFWTIDINPTKEDWITWARSNKIDNLIIEFLSTRQGHLYVDLNSVNPGEVFPTPASWSRFDESLKFNSIDLIDVKSQTSLIYNLALGFIGSEAAIEFSDYVNKYEVDVKPEDLLMSYERCKVKLDNMSNDRINSLIERLGEHAKDNVWTLQQAENAAKLAKTISEEMVIHFWSVITRSENVETIQAFHTHIGEYIVEVVTNNKSLLKNK